MKSMKHFMWHDPQLNFYALDLYALDIKDAKGKIRDMLGVKRLPTRVDIWSKR